MCKFYPYISLLLRFTLKVKIHSRVFLLDEDETHTNQKKVQENFIQCPQSTFIREHSLNYPKYKNEIVS